MQLRNFLEEARLSIREGRFEDAAIALTGARSLGVTVTAEIEIVDSELSDARSEQRVDDTLAQAAARLEEGKLTEPSNDNARYFYELVLSNDSQNAAALQGLSVIASQLVLQARTQIDRGNFNTAEALLTDAKKLDPSSEAVAESTTALNTAREREALELRQEADRQAAAERQAAEERAAQQRAAEQIAAEQIAAEQRAAEQIAAEQIAAEQIAAEQRAAEQRVAEQEAAEQEAADAAAATDTDEQISDSVVGQSGGDDASSRTDTAALAAVAIADTESGLVDNGAAASNIETPADAVDEVSTGPVGTLSADSQTDAAEDQSVEPYVLNDTPMSMSQLNRTKYVAPKYPRAAQRRNLSGWVDVVFIVTVDGLVRDITILGSEPGVTFVNAATKAIEDWKFEPVVENGSLVEKRTAVRLMFAME
jgi:TonB family protein